MPYPQKEAENDEENSEVDQLSSNQLSRARLTSSNGLVMPLLMIMHDVISRDKSYEAEEVMSKVDVQDPESCLCQVLQMGSGTWPLYKYLRYEILTIKMCQVTNYNWIRDMDISGELELKAKDGVAAIYKCLAMGPVTSSFSYSAATWSLEPCLIRMVMG